MQHQVAIDPGFEARVRGSFARQRAMALIGAELTRVEPGLCEIELLVRDDLTQQHGFVHGGIVGMIADSAAGYAGYTLMPADASVLTIEYKINMLAPARGERLVACGTVIKSGRTLAVAHADVHAIAGGKRTLIAAAQQTLMVMHGASDDRI
jgi:uncharacterized protein (TIGR00369 family)